MTAIPPLPPTSIAEAYESAYHACQDRTDKSTPLIEDNGQKDNQGRWGAIYDERDYYDVNDSTRVKDGWFAAHTYL